MAAELVRRLPEIARTLPKPAELRTIALTNGAAGDGAGALVGLVAALRGVVPELFERPAPKG